MEEETIQLTHHMQPLVWPTENSINLTVANGSCPVYATGCGNGTRIGNIGPGPSGVAIASSSISCLGSILIVVAFIAFKDIRSGMAQRIITALAIADFISAAGYISGSINYLVYLNHTDQAECDNFDKLCRTQAFFTSWSSMSSFAWTAILAVYFYLVLVFQKRRPFHSKIQETALHLFAWLTPGLIVIPFTVLNFLGYASFAASNWCFVRATSPDNSTSATLNIAYTTLKVLGVGKLWEILTYFIVIIIYSHIFIILEKMRRNNYEAIARPDRNRVERKMIYIPLFFLFLRMWGTIEFFVNIAMEATHPSEKPGCIPPAFYYTNLVLGYLQAIGDPGQGWGNAFLYVFLSDAVRKRMFFNPLKKCCRRIGRRLINLAQDSEDQEDTEQQGNNEGAPPPQAVNKGRERETPDIMRRRAIQRYDTVSTISAGDISQPGPIDEAKPGPSPVNELEGQRHVNVLDTIISEATTTTTTTAVQA